jgi:hypothetical protein
MPVFNLNKIFFEVSGIAAIGLLLRRTLVLHYFLQHINMKHAGFPRPFFQIFFVITVTSILCFY